MLKRNKILIHILFWFYILNQSLFPLYINKMHEHYYNDLIISMLLNIICFYSFYSCLTFLLRKGSRFSIFAISAFVVIMLVPLRIAIDFLFWKYIALLPKKELVITSLWVGNELRMVIITITYATLIRFTIDWFDTQKIKTELINIQQSSELALLRSQVNPHFLFNTLNNIYSLVYSKSDEAPAAVMKLSSLMRYMLYDSSSDMVYLEKEIDYIKSFIELQELRLKSSDFVEVEINGSIEGIKIAPMLLIPYIENAFKHCSKTKSPGIKINIEISDKKLEMTVKNYVKKLQDGQSQESSGIGMINTKRRLELLYPDKHKVNIKSDGHSYEIRLTINTN